jgi:hypothetical protein
MIQTIFLEGVPLPNTLLKGGGLVQPGEATLIML